MTGLDSSFARFYLAASKGADEDVPDCAPMKASKREGTG